jgi:hypothetical protein
VGFWPRVRARALRTPVFLGSLPRPTGAARPPAHRSFAAPPKTKNKLFPLTTWPKLGPPGAYIFLYWAKPHSTELHYTLLSSAAPSWAMLHPIELRCTLLSTKLCCIQLSYLRRTQSELSCILLSYAASLNIENLPNSGRPRKGLFKFFFILTLPPAREYRECQAIQSIYNLWTTYKCYEICIMSPDLRPAHCSFADLSGK